MIKKKTATFIRITKTSFLSNQNFSFYCILDCSNITPSQRHSLFSQKLRIVCKQEVGRWSVGTAFWPQELILPLLVGQSAASLRHLHRNQAGSRGSPHRRRVHALLVPFFSPPARWEFSVSIWEFGAHVLGFTHWHLTVLTSGKKIYTSSFFSWRLKQPETSLRIKEQKIRPENYFHHACSSETECIYKPPLDCHSAV